MDGRMGGPSKEMFGDNAPLLNLVGVTAPVYNPCTMKAQILRKERIERRLFSVTCVESTGL
jgi:hypothetical protein